MCGIVGYIGNRPIKNELIEMLKLLEYRGYDSAGIGTLADGKIKIYKSVGNISCLEHSLPNKLTAHTGIGHTRWATHGKPSVANAHPHCSSDGSISVVHNGIIENYKDLKKKLEILGAKFYSSTDTEVIAKLLEFSKEKSMLNKLISVTKKLSGSYALAILNSKQNKTIYLAKHKSPLYVAIGNNESIVASDPVCFKGKAKCYYSLEDDEVAKLTETNVIFYDKSGNEITKFPTILEDKMQSYSKLTKSHYMIKEIEEIPNVLNNIINTYSDYSLFNNLTPSLVKSIKRIKLIGCGTAYHACEMGARLLENNLKIESTAHIASEFRYSSPLLNKSTLCIFISQSGETADTIGALELAKNKGAYCIVITNCMFSTLSKLSDLSLPVLAGREVAVASTKAYVGQIAVCYCLTGYLNNNIFKKRNKIEYIKNLTEVKNNYKIYSKKELDSIIKLLAKVPSAFFIGRETDYITSQEASLKIKEICYINCNAYPSGELKHGFIALVEEGTIMFVVATNKALLPKTLNGINEVKSRGGKIILLTQFNKNEFDENIADYYIKLPDVCEELMPIVAISPLFSLAYYTSVLKGNNPDMPRNLAKSVTVE